MLVGREIGLKLTNISTRTASVPAEREDNIASSTIFAIIYICNSNFNVSIRYLTIQHKGVFAIKKNSVKVKEVTSVLEYYHRLIEN